ncbi:flagellar hook-associated protein FlgK [Vreelandella populi]|uniref:Flagellar hook-associated protein 1 n=1 Tax=Vreelandella populi TaxID=2498858 RepID=A0A433L9M8_9GAMM|nr:flagellar hook-associated protein FlgK [Halomonas populi]RUR41402.1 flagellar hook-associated protein FlgK [Halomonas populi]RUR44194.1 flagellar hook-associated protein FlgK [Halomonas populi]RUR56186.1 flagellar hook-associated protein FlgK [Halomonas populi]
MSMFSVGLSGLNAAQNALNTTSNNISNVFTPGYNRELAQLGEGRVGGGVRVDSIERQFNTYVANQLNNAKTQSSALNTYNNQISQIDNLLADREAGLSPLMQNFFSSLDAVASAPSDPAARQGVLGTANTLSSQFRSFDGYLQDMQSNINNQIKDEVTQVNNTVEQIAGLNKEISLARARSGEAPNSLLNQRDQLVSDLNERMDLRLNVQDGKTYNISLPNGQPLVTGTNSFKLTTMQAGYDPQRTVVGYRDGGGNVIQLDESAIKGGALGGLMAFRSETLDKTQNQIGQLAVSLSVAFNEQHKQGIDLNGNEGEDLFRVRTPQAYSHMGNSTDIASIEFDAANINQLRATDYTVSYSDDAFTVKRNDSGASVDFEWENDTLSFGGINISFASMPVNGDTFEVQPVRRAGSGMDVNITDLDKIAAGSEASSGDNRNALALQELQSKNIVGGSASVSGAYGALVSDVGNRANITQVNLEARQGLTDQLRAVQQSESGVNLDEEAANLIRYQQYYMANARVIDTAGSIMDTILNLRS